MLLLLACARPDVGDETFELIDGPEGLVRVHFTRQGADAVDPTDEDSDGLPDRAEEALSSGESAIRFYQVAGFPLPVPDDGVGGSDALDIYVVQPHVGGAWGVTSCGSSCYVEVSPTEEQVEMLVAHEVFHASTAAYGVEPAFWFRESSAIWMGAQATAMGQMWRDQWNLAHTCAMGGVEVGSDCLAAAYGSALWWEFLERTRGPDVLLRSWEITAEDDVDVADAMDAALREAGTSLEEAWPTVANWNLATGELVSETALPTEAYEHATTITAPAMDAEGETLRLTATIEPLSIRYYLVHHPGGHVWIGTGGDGRDLRVSLHSAEGALDAYPIDTSAPAYGLPKDGDLDLGYHERGPVYLVVSNPSPRGLVTPIQLCVDTTPCDPGCGNLSLAWIGVGLVRIPGRRRRARPIPTHRPAGSSPGR